MKPLRKVCVWALSLTMTIALRAGVRAEEGAPPPEPPAPVPGRVTVGVLSTDAYVEGIGDVVVPLFYTETGLLFLNPRASFTDRSEREYNVGLGYRRLIRDHRAILGATAYYDHRETRAGSSFDQVGFGMEYLSHWFDVRANAYFPVDDRKLAREFTHEEHSASRAVRTSHHTAWHDPYAAGHSVLQDYDSMRTTETRTTNTVRTRYFREYEVAFRGWDAEVGGLLPVPYGNDNIRIKPYLGYYHYAGKYGLDDIDGFRARLEVQFRPAVYLDFTYYADDALTGGNYSVGAYVSVPFCPASLAGRSNPFAGGSDRWDAGRNAGDIRHRLADKVRRDPQIRSRLTEPEEQVDMQTIVSRSRTRTVTEKVDERTVHVATDITFVDGTRGDDGNPGTFEEPKLTIQGAVDDDPRSRVFVFEADEAYEGAIFTRDNVFLHGEGFPIEGRDGRVFGSGVHPVVNRGDLAPTFSVGNLAMVAGFEIMNQVAGVALGDGIHATGIASGIDIGHNHIHTTMTGVVIDNTFSPGSIDVYIIENRIVDNQLSGASVTIAGSDPDADRFVLAAFGNHFNNNGVFGLEVTATDVHTAIAGIGGGGEASHNAGGGIACSLLSSSLSVIHAGLLSASHNQAITTPTGHGMDLNARSLSGQAFIWVQECTTHVNAGRGVQAHALGSEGAVVFFDDVSAGWNALDGFTAHVTSFDEDAFLILAGVDAAHNQGRGISANFVAGGDLVVAVTDVHASHNDDEGLWLATDLPVAGRAHVFMSEAALQEMAFWGYESGIDVVEHARTGPSTFIGNGWDVGIRSGAQIEFEAEGNVMADIVGNTFSGNSGAGVRLDLTSIDHLSQVRLLENEASDNGANGFHVEARGGFVEHMAGADLILFRNSAARNTLQSGAYIALDGRAQYFVGGDNRFHDNNVGIQLEAGPGADWYHLDLGDPMGMSEGHNALFGNTMFNVRNSGFGQLSAQENWWGEDPPDAGLIDGDVLFDFWLSEDPHL